MPLDTRIAISGNNPLDTQAKLMTLAELSDQQQARGLQMQQTRDNMQRQQQLRSLLGGLAPDTSDDGRVGALRSAGYFDEADKLQTGVLARNKTNAEVGKIGAETGRITQETWDKRRETAIKDIAGFQTPEEARRDLIENVRAGRVDPLMGEQLHRSIPQDPAAFRQWQIGMLRRIMEAKDASAALTPKVEIRNMGGSEQVFTTDQPTGQVTPGASFARSQSPDSAASNDTTRRGQNMVDARSREGNDIARQAARTQVVETPDGYMLVDKGTSLARPAATMGGAQVQGKDQGLNDTQAKALLFGSRMRDADKVLVDLAGAGVTQPSLIKRGAEAVPLVGSALGMAANAVAASPQQQQVEQAQRDFINAVLRRESGAAIAADEFANARQQYFPQPGDSGAVKEQKARNRQLAINGLLAEVPAKRRNSIGAGAPPGLQVDTSAGVPDDIAAILRKHGGK